jgi:hypothetical protein
VPLSRHDPALASSLDQLRRKLDEIAGAAGLPNPGAHRVEDLLAQLPYPARRRMALAIEAARLHGQLRGDRGLVATADHMLALAADLWRHDQGTGSGPHRGLPRSLRAPG